MTPFRGLALGITVALSTSLLAPRRGLAEVQRTLVVGAKNFTEGGILGELMAQVLETRAGVRVERRFNLAGTKVAFDALQAGAIDVYAEYTGTGLRDILASREPATAAQAFARVSAEFQRRFDLLWLAPFGFNDTYVLIMRRDRAAALSIQRISDLAAQPLRYGMSHEFLERADGLPGLRTAYTLNPASLVGMEHDLAYRALADGAIDVADGYSTDAKMATLDLVVLEDDKRFFPPYEAAPLIRNAVAAQQPRAVAALAMLAGRIDAETMRHLNYAVEGEHRSPADVAAGYLARLGLADRHDEAAPPPRSLAALLWYRRAVTGALTAWHLVLTLIAELLACAVAIPLGIIVSRRPAVAAAATGGAGVLQTVPSIALLAFMLPLFGVGAVPAVAALFLYGLLPVLRNTISGLRSVDGTLTEVGTGLGMSRGQLLRRVELPLAVPTIFAGIRVSTVINIGTATLAAFIGAGGLGEPIVTGLTTGDTNLILTGALPAAALALAVDGVLALLERWATPRGLRPRA